MLDRGGKPGIWEFPGGSCVGAGLPGCPEEPGNDVASGTAAGGSLAGGSGVLTKTPELSRIFGVRPEETA